MTRLPEPGQSVDEPMPAIGPSEALTRVVAFGDSYLDSGAALRLSTEAVAANVPSAKVLPALPTDATYAVGRWSDGPSMVEVLARELGVGLTNYAIGGAKGTFGNYHAWLDYYADTGLGGQIDGFEVALRGQRADPDAVYVVSAGANDYFQFHDFRQPGYVGLDDTPRLSYAAIASRAARSVMHGATRLWSLGARRLVVFDAYAIEATPWVVAVEPQLEHAVSYTSAFDATLGLEFERVRGLHPGITRFPIGEHMRAIMVRADTYGMTDTRSACQPVMPVPGPRRGAPERFYWWDEFHPTARVHEVLGEILVRLVQGE